MKRKGWILPLAVLMALTLAMPAFADVMWEPYGNNFYEAHRDECQYENRTYLANGPEGYLTLRESPQSSAEVINIVNGESVYVGYLWTDGKGDQWGVAEYGVTSDSGERTWHDGWAPLSQLALVYDHICFEEDHGDELEAYDGSWGRSDGDHGIRLSWRSPGHGRQLPGGCGGEPPVPVF